MSLAKYPAAHVFDTTGLGGQGGPNPNQVGDSYTSLTIVRSPSNKSPKGYGDDITRKKYRYPQKSQLNTTDTLANRDEFDLSRANDLT